MTRSALSALALSVLAGAGLAACSANFKPNTVTFPGSSTQAVTTQAASTSNAMAPALTSAQVPAAATATSVASAPTEPAPATPAATSASPAATAVSTPAAVPISMPTRGMLMSAVAREFGEPEQKLPAVPDPGTKLHPPITRWVYPQYVVYFEYNYVVHSVLKTHPFSNPSAGTG